MLVATDMKTGNSLVGMLPISLQQAVASATPFYISKPCAIKQQTNVINHRADILQPKTSQVLQWLQVVLLALLHSTHSNQSFSSVLAGRVGLDVTQKGSLQPC
mmetsp:Transcript_28512/g.76915  ORF Transcript_28512/g.76915 Transcript_28512/m.76915 type:complete len:103 (-) Transcript_28512:1182-1490(-)